MVLSLSPWKKWEHRAENHDVERHMQTCKQKVPKANSKLELGDYAFALGYGACMRKIDRKWKTRRAYTRSCVWKAGCNALLGKDSASEAVSAFPSCFAE